MKYYLITILVFYTTALCAQIPKKSAKRPITLYYTNNYYEPTSEVYAKGYTTLSEKDALEIRLKKIMPINDVYQSEGRVGKWTYYHKNGQIKITGEYTDNLATGKWTHYFENGTISSEESFDDDGYENGSFKFYFENGQIETDYKYKKNEPYGVWKRFNRDGGVISRIDHEKGILTNYHDNGKIYEEIEFGYGNGDQLFFKKYNSYYANGNKYVEGQFDENATYKNFGKISEQGMGWFKTKGIWMLYWENGDPATEYDFENNTTKVIKTQYANKYPYESGGYGKGQKVLSDINFRNSDDASWVSFSGIPKYQGTEAFNKGNSRKAALSSTTMVKNAGSFMRTGIWEYWNDNNILESKIEYSWQTNKPTGLAEFYYPNGKLKRTGTHNKEGQPAYTWKYYFENGSLSEERPYQNGKIHGIDIDYFENGKIKDKAAYADGKIVGVKELYHPNGQLLGKENYKDGKFVSYADMFDENGTITMQSGSGSTIEYYENGKVSFKGSFLNSKKHGLCTWYFKNGNPEEEFNYSNGTNDGAYTLYFEKGGVRQKGKYINGKLEGEVEYYHPNSRLLGKDKYEKGEFAQLLDYFDETGKPTLTNGSGLVLFYNELGNITAKVPYLNYCRDGKAEWFYNNGKLKEAAIYKYSETAKPKGLRWEILISYDENGKERDKGTLKNGNGTWITYDDNGKASTTEYVNGLPKK